MPEFTIWCEWAMTGNVTVEAPSLDEAIRMVEDEEEPYQGLPPDDREYIDDTFAVIRDSCKPVDEDED